MDLVTDYDCEGIRLFKFMKKTLKDLMAVDPDLLMVKEKLVQDYQCTEEKAQHLAGQFLVRRKDVQNYMSHLILSENRMGNFNWSISLVMSSAHKAVLKEPLLHLQVNLENGYEDTRVLLEFNYQELCKFIEEVNQVKDKCLGY